MKRKLHKGTKRPLWSGPEVGCYYYMVKNKPWKHGAGWVVRFSDDPQYEKHIRQIVCVHGGHWSLIESDIPLPIQPSEGKLLKRDKVEQVKRRLRESMPRVEMSKTLDANGNRTRIEKEGTSIHENEVFV